MKTRFVQCTVVALTLLFSLFTLADTAHAETKIGLAWAGKSGMALRVTSGLTAGLNELAPQIKVEHHQALPDINALAEVISQFHQNMDGMVILRSNGAAYLANNPPRIPTFIGACNHPGQLGAIQNLEAPEGNITGVTYFLPKETQFEIFQAILPDMNSLILLVEKGHPSSAIDQQGTEKMCNRLNLKCTYQHLSTEDEVLNTVKNNAGKVSAFIIGAQALVIDMADRIVEVAGSTPTLSYSSKPVKAGALGGFVAEDEKLGRMLAESVVDVLINGQAIKSVPVRMDPRPKFYVNTTTAQKLGVEIPYEILESATLIE